MYVCGRLRDIANLKELSRGSPHTHRKCAMSTVGTTPRPRRPIRTSRNKGVHTCTSWEQDVNSFVAQEDA